MKNDLRPAWSLACREPRRNGVGWLISAGFCLYMAAMLFPLIRQALTTESSAFATYVSEWAMNVFLLAMIPYTGFLIGRRYLNYHRRDSFTQRLRTMKCLPISDKVLVLARYLQLLVTAPIMTLFTLIPLCIIFRYDEKMMFISNVDFIWLGVTWLACAILMGIVFLFFLISVAAVIVLLAPFWLLAIQGVQSFGILVPFVFIIIAAATLLICATKLERRQAVRDLQ